MRIPTLIILAASLAFGGCASTGAVPRPYPGGLPTRADAGVVPVPSPSESMAGGPLPTTMGAAVAAAALRLVGTPYRAGGQRPEEGFDCSGFVQFVVQSAGARVPRSVREQWEAGMPVDAADVVAGDLVFFAIDGGEVSHVGVALGGDEFVHAPSSRGVVRVERLSSAYWARRYAGARRVGGRVTSSGADWPTRADCPR